MFTTRIEARQREHIKNAKLKLRIHETEPINEENIQQYNLLQMIVEWYELGFILKKNNDN